MCQTSLCAAQAPVRITGGADRVAVVAPPRPPPPPPLIQGLMRRIVNTPVVMVGGGENIRIMLTRTRRPILMMVVGSWG